MNEDLSSVKGSIKHGYAQIGGVRLHYAQSGSGDRLVILLHGFPECWYSWRHQLIALGEHFTVVAPDLRGYNLSDKPPRIEDYRLRLLVDDIIGLIRHFGKDDAAIVGHDWGAWVAWGIAAKHPEYVWKLVALQVVPYVVWRKNMTLKQALHSWYMLFFQLPLIPEWFIRRNDFAALEEMFRKTVARPGAINETDIAVYKTAMREPGALTSALNYYRANFRRMFFPKRGEGRGDRRIRVPSMFIYGEQDQAVVPETVRGVGDYIDAPYKELRIKHSAHWVQQEAREEVTGALLSFLGTS